MTTERVDISVQKLQNGQYEVLWQRWDIPLRTVKCSRDCAHHLIVGLMDMEYIGSTLDKSDAGASNFLECADHLFNMGSKRIGEV